MTGILPFDRLFFEAMTGPYVSVFNEFGGGFKTLSGAEANPHLIGVSWLRSGFA